MSLNGKNENSNERLIEFLNKTGYSIAEIAVECGMESSRRTLYKIFKEGHKPSPKMLRKIKERFNTLDIPYILNGQITNEVSKTEENSDNNLNNEKLMDNTKALIEMKDQLKDAVLNQATMTNHFFQKLNQLEESNNKARQQMLDLHQDVLALIKTTHAWNGVREQLASHMVDSNKVNEEVKTFINTVLPPKEELGKTQTIRKKH
jgi:transcriptional regulator with XRE-family HTH domain